MSSPESERRKGFATHTKRQDVSGSPPPAPDEKGVVGSSEQGQNRAKLERAYTESTKSEDKYRVMVDTIPTLAWRSLANGSVEFFNQRWHDYTGLSPQEAHYWGWKVTIHPEDLEKSMEKWRALLASGQPGELEARLRRSDGEYRWFLFRSEPLRDERDEVVGWYGNEYRH